MVKKTFHIVFLLYCCILVTSRPLVLMKELNLTNADSLCRGIKGCNFFNSAIWANESVPEDGDYIFIIYLLITN